MKRFCIFTCVLFLPAVASIVARADRGGWEPVDPALLAGTTPKVEQDADAEAIFWDVHVEDWVSGEMPYTELKHYLRVKIFNERGKESQSRIDIPFGKQVQIIDIAGRTIRPDGSIVELKNSDVFERTIVKGRGVKVRAKSFVMPAVEPGAIIEYRWTEERYEHVTFYDRLQFSRDIPIQRVSYHIKPLDLASFDYEMRSVAFHCTNTPFEKDRDGFFTTSMTNVRAFREEASMPPEDQVRPWLLLYYAEEKPPSAEDYWNKFGARYYEALRTGLKPGRDVREASATAIAGASTDEEKLRKLYDWLRATVKNTESAAAGFSDGDRAAFKAAKSPAEALERGIGTPGEIDLLFASLAIAAGFDARMAPVANRSDLFFHPSLADGYFLQASDVAVKVGNDWHFFDPGSPYLPYGMLIWQEEGVNALIPDGKKSTFVITPLSPPERSCERRVAALRLDADGTLEGDGRIELSGHLGRGEKLDWSEASPEQREAAAKDFVKDVVGEATLTDVVVENLADPDKPVVYSFHLKLPGYAQRTGKRLFVQPAVFQRALEPRFTSAERRWPVYFHHPWAESDSVTIAIPAGFTLDNADAPRPFMMGDFGRYDVSIGVTTSGDRLVFQREFRFGRLLVEAADYDLIKRDFDRLHECDAHTIALKQAGAEAR